MNLLQAIAEQVYIKCETIEELDKVQEILKDLHFISKRKNGLFISIYECDYHYPNGAYSFELIGSHLTITAQSFINSNTTA